MLLLLIFLHFVHHFSIQISIDHWLIPKSMPCRGPHNMMPTQGLPCNLVFSIQGGNHSLRVCAHMTGRYRAGEAASIGLTEALTGLGFEAGRLKTGTPARVDIRSVDFSKLERQPGQVLLIIHCCCHI